MFRSKRKAVNITRLPDLKVIPAHYGKFEGDTMNITMYRVFCCDRWRHCFKANKTVILTREGSVHYFSHLTLFQLQYLVLLPTANSLDLC